MNAKELAERYPDNEFRAKLRRLLRLRVFLEKSIIGPDYRVNAELHSPIKLTEYGDRYFQVLTRKQVPYPEARLMCFLQLYGTDLLVDPEATDADALQEAISKEIKNQRLRYPFTYGRYLYDLVADNDARPGNRFYLPERDAWSLLSKSLQGVAQVGQILAGPFGILVSAEQRSLEPERSARYHCADLTCNEIHKYWLPTSSEAPINKERPKLSKEIEREGPKQSEFTEFLANTNRSAASFIYDDQNADTLPILIGDTLDDQEKKQLLSWLLDNTKGSIREKVRPLGLNGKAESMVSDLSPAEVMQLIMLARNEEISEGLDTLVTIGKIAVPEGETRRTILNNIGFGPYSLYCELNCYGVRVAAFSQNIAPLRLRRLVGQMYPFDSESDRQELEWQLRDEGAEATEVKLDHYLRKKTPREAVSNLLLARRVNIVVASEKLRMTLELLNDDTQRVNTALWKLGYETDDAIDPHGRFWRFHEALSGACRQALLNPPAADMEKMRERAVNYFITLEEVLRDCLLYVTWAMTSDHYKSDRGFVYRPHIDSALAAERLRQFASKDAGDHQLDMNEPLSLYALTRGFGLLSDLLGETLADMQRHERSNDDLPEWVGFQDLQSFPFYHDLLFLDLAESSRGKILDELRGISKGLVAADVSDVRNSLLHPRPADLHRLSVALEAIELAMRTIQRSGYSRGVYKIANDIIDEAGRGTTTLTSAYGETVLLHTPSHLDWVGLPGPKGELGNGLHFMPAAYTADPVETMRFSTACESAYSRMWENFPRRPDLDDESSDLAFKLSGTGIG